MQQQIGGSPHQQQMQPSNKGQNYNSNQQQWIRSNASPMSSIPPHHYASPPHPQQPIDGLPQQQQFITIQHRPGQQQLIQHHSPGILGSMSPPSNNMMDQRQQQIIHKGQIVQTSRLQNYAPPSQMQSQPQQQQQIRQQRQPRQTHNSMEVMQQPGQIQPQHHQLLQQDHLPPSNAPPPSVHHCYQQQEPEMIGPPPPGNPIHQPQHYAAQQGQPPIHSMVGGIPMGPASAGPQQHQSPSPSIRIRPSSSLSHMHPAPPPPLAHHHQQQQRILVHQQQTPIMPPPNEQQMPPPPPSAAAAHPSPYVGSLRFLNAIMAETDSQQNVSPKRKYRELKKKFKFLVYENEYYQEELRNLQRKLLKLSRDKNFLLDKLGQYENFTESSDDSDASTKTLEERGAQKTKRKQKQPATRKRAAPNAGQSLATTKRNCGGGGNNAKSSRKKAEIEKQNANPTTALEENTNVGKVELKEEEEKINEEQQSTSKMMEIEAKKETIEGESCGLRAPKNEDNFQQQISSDN